MFNVVTTRGVFATRDEASKVAAETMSGDNLVISVAVIESARSITTALRAAARTVPRPPA